MKSLLGFLKFLVLAAFVLAGFIFTTKNPDPVALWLVVDFGPRPAGFWLLLAFAAGGITGLLFGFGLFRKLRLDWEVRQLQSRLRHCESELASFHAARGQGESVRDADVPQPVRTGPLNRNPG